VTRKLYLYIQNHTTMKLFNFFLPITFFVFFNCGGVQNSSRIKLEDNPPFTISEATYQDWVAGVQGAGSGTNVTIMVASMEPGVNIKQLYFHQDIVPVQAIAGKDNMYTASLKTDLNQGGDTEMNIDPKQEAKNTPPTKIPFELGENEAVVSYEYQGETAYYKVENMVRKPMMALPSTNGGTGIEN